MTAQMLCSWCRNRSQEDILAEAKRLLDKGYYQTSRRYRMLARLPDDKNGQEIRNLIEAQIGDCYLRVYAPEKDRVTVACHRVFEAFRNLGGATYLAARFHPKEQNADC